MKIGLLLIVTLGFAIRVQASDSVAVFHRPQKVVVLINERGASGRIQEMMNVLGVSEFFEIKSPDESVTGGCKRNETVATCTITFLPSEKVLIEPKKMQSTWSYEELKVSPRIDFEIAFESSQGDKFTLIMSKQTVQLSASKR